MTTLDFTPLYRTVIGVDRMANMFNGIDAPESNGGFPAYNVEVVSENNYLITLALAGYTLKDIEIEQENNQLKIVGKKPDAKTEAKYLYQGIAKRAFERRFKLADHVDVTSARLENGMLFVALTREVPESLKPRKISISESALLE